MARVVRVQVDTIKYSVPNWHAGQTLDVRIAGEQVAILADGEIVATHKRGTRRHGFVTDRAHAPYGYEDISLLWTRAYFPRKAAKVGPYTVEALTRLLDRMKVEAQGYRSCMNILGLDKGTNAPCWKRHARSSARRKTQCRSATPRSSIASLSCAQPMPSGQQSTKRPARVSTGATAPARGKRDTSSAYLGGISQFSLDALTWTTGAKDGKGVDRA